MLQVFPFLAWLAAIMSAILLVALRMGGELGGVALGLLGVWFLVAGYCQFFSASAMTGALGAAAQTLLAIYLIVRWKLAGITR